MTNFGQLFASRESLAIMLAMASKSQKQERRSNDRFIRHVLLGEKRVEIDLRLLTTTTSKGI